MHFYNSVQYSPLRSPPMYSLSKLGIRPIRNLKYIEINETRGKLFLHLKTSNSPVILQKKLSHRHFSKFSLFQYHLTLFISEILNYFFILPTSHFNHLLQGQFVQYRALGLYNTEKMPSVSVVLLQFKFRKSDKK